MLFDHINKRLLIIGASGGVGFAMTQILLEQGHQLFVTTRNRNSRQAASLVKIAEVYPQQLTILQMDITDQESVATLFNELNNHTDRLHLVMNCSGLLHDGALQPEKRLEDLDFENLHRSFSVNTIGPLLIARYALALLKHDESSVVANMSARVGSISDNRIGGWYGYRASKAAQNMATRTVAIEMKRRSKHTIVVGLHPGTVDTSLSKPFQRGVKPGQLKTAAQAAASLCQVIDGLQTEDSGKVFAWDGSEILP